ncbi:hypothetical protein EYC98_18990 [Halieaceae bacterium IMCC14734]|uniref:Dicarboxylate transport domain-containing protein n=1 Tax=Candidatus Litorirhabdus singularis TaxID=2518993 RepID=A0ABT3TKX8_9GAMM|nr:YdbH domain-containing protein [Candidatus Litorirhabdus singularis]MCX2982953.1 hypothetical protein [Candidatus Litorirhabdus singularis]
MKPVRIFLAVILLLLLSLLGAGVYAWFQLPALLTTHLSTLLSPHGVQSFSVAEITRNGSRLELYDLRVAANRNGQKISLELETTSLDFSWRSLLQARLDSAFIDRAQISLAPATAGDGTEETALRISELLPSSLLQQLPVNKIEVGSWQLNYPLSEDQTLVLTGQLFSAEELRFKLETSLHGATTSLAVSAPPSGLPLSATLAITAADLTVAETTMELTSDQSELWQWNIKGIINHPAMLSWVARLTEAELLPPELVPTSQFAVGGSSGFEFDIRHPDLLQSPDFPLQGGTSRVVATGQGHSAISHITLGETISGATAELDWSLNYAADISQLVLSAFDFQAALPVAELGLSPAQLEWLQWSGEIPLRWQSLQAISLSQLGTHRWQLSSPESNLRIGTGSSELRLNNIELQSLLNVADATAANSELRAGLMLSLRQQKLPLLSLELSQQSKRSSQAFHLRIADITESLRLELAGLLEIETGVGQYQLNVTSPDLPWLTSMMLPIWRELMGSAPRLVLAEGALSLHSDLLSEGFSAPQWQHQSTLEIANLTGTWDDYLFENGTLSAAWSGWENPKTNAPVRLAIDRLNLGIELNQVTAQLSLPGNPELALTRIRLESFSADVFSGRVIMPEPSEWNLGAERNALRLRAENLQLSEIVALQQNQDISAGGVLEGEIPLQFSAGRFTIGNGYLQALAPGGSIRYALDESSKALAETSEQLRLALDLLNDFHYQVLASTVDLDQNGQLRLGLSLTGSNPSYENGRQVNFNINLEQNLDPLLQSLRLSDSLLQKLEDGLR